MMQPLIDIIKLNQDELSICAWKLARYLLYQSDTEIHDMIASELFALALAVLQDPCSTVITKAVLQFLACFVTRADLYCVSASFCFD